MPDDRPEWVSVMLCTECNGSRACDICDGYGDILGAFPSMSTDCEACDGSGVCPGCFGEGETPTDSNDVTAHDVRPAELEAVR